MLSMVSEVAVQNFKKSQESQESSEFSYLISTDPGLHYGSHFSMGPVLISLCLGLTAQACK